jgi:hypothetical protein
MGRFWEGCCINRGGKSSPDTPSQQPDQRVRITHAAHALRGVLCLVISPAGRWQDPTQILIELPNGERRFIPISWSDLSTEPVYPEGMRFPLERLVVLQQRLEAMQVGYNLSIMAAKTEFKPGGGGHASFDSNHLGSIDPAAANTDHPHLGADAPSSNDAERGGAG